MKQTLLSAAMLTLTMGAAAQTTLTIDASQRGAQIETSHYGIFFEEINHAGDGGLYAELVRNRNFRENTKFWTATGGTTIDCDSTTMPLNQAQPKCLKATFAVGGAVENEGYWGMGFENGKAYRLSLWVRADKKYKGQVRATLIGDDGQAIGEATLQGSIGTKWQKMEATLISRANAKSGRLQLSASQSATLYMDVVSLFPPTFMNRPNGCREDLAQKLADLHPAFMRFPGGCVVEGLGTLDQQNRFNWRKTIGPIEEREGHWNGNWKYEVNDGLGFLEYLQLCEDLGAEPLFVCNIGLGHGFATGYEKDDLKELINEVLDAIEYANGDATTKYGAMRIRDGHPAPFNLRMIEIGNENNQNENPKQQSDHYYARYKTFREAILAKYPDMYLIGNVIAWGTDHPVWRGGDVEAVDEHYYRSPDWFAGSYHKYDTYERGTHKVYVGEYAVTKGYGRTGNLRAALGEAIYMMGTERNGDVVNMTSYAPIFINEHDQRWRPDMIRFNASQSFGTPSYYVQRMFANHCGRQNVASSLEDLRPQQRKGTVGVGTWATAATFTNIRLTLPDGSTVAMADTALTDIAATPAFAAMTQQTDGDNIIYKVRARKNAGEEGFLIAIDWQDEKNFIWWNLGGWGGKQSGIETCTDGSKGAIEQKPFTVETGRDYDLEVRYDGSHIVCSVDGQVLHDVRLQTVYADASIDDEKQLMVIKMVNFGQQPCPMTISLKGAVAESATAEEMTSASAADENTMQNPFRVIPYTKDVPVSSTAIDYPLPANAVTVITVKLKE